MNDPFDDPTADPVPVNPELDAVLGHHGTVYREWLAVRRILPDCTAEREAVESSARAVNAVLCKLAVNMRMGTVAELESWLDSLEDVGDQ